MVSQLRKFTDPNERVQIVYKLSGAGNNERWRWSAYSKNEAGEFKVFRCMGPPRGFEDYDVAVADSRDLLNVAGE